MGSDGTGFFHGSVHFSPRGWAWEMLLNDMVPSRRTYKAKTTLSKLNWEEWISWMKLDLDTLYIFVRYVPYAPCFQTFNLDIFSTYLLDLGHCLMISLFLSFSPSLSLIGNNCAQEHLNWNSLCLFPVHSNIPHTPAFQMRFISIVFHCPSSPSWAFGVTSWS